MRQLLSILFIVFVAGCVTSNNTIETEDIIMKTEKGDRVAVHYTGTLNDGSQFDSSEGRDPLEFEVGAGQMIKGFDEAVVGMKEGEEKTIKLKPEDAYGNIDEKLIRDIPKSQLPEGTKVGDTLNAQGQPVKVVSIEGDNVKVDFNHALAGQELTFKIKMVSITKK